MDKNLLGLPLEERIRLVEDLWDSIAEEQGALPLTPEQRQELDRRLQLYRSRGPSGKGPGDAIDQARRLL